MGQLSLLPDSDEDLGEFLYLGFELDLFPVWDKFHKEAAQRGLNLDPRAAADADVLKRRRALAHRHGLAAPNVNELFPHVALESRLIDGCRQVMGPDGEIAHQCPGCGWVKGIVTMKHRNTDLREEKAENPPRRKRLTLHCRLCDAKLGRCRITADRPIRIR